MGVYDDLLSRKRSQDFRKFLMQRLDISRRELVLIYEIHGCDSTSETVRKVHLRLQRVQLGIDDEILVVDPEVSSGRETLTCKRKNNGFLGVWALDSFLQLF